MDAIDVKNFAKQWKEVRDEMMHVLLVSVGGMDRLRLCEPVESSTSPLRYRRVLSEALGFMPHVGLLKNLRKSIVIHNPNKIVSKYCTKL